MSHNIFLARLVTHHQDSGLILCAQGFGPWAPQLSLPHLVIAKGLAGGWVRISWFNAEVGQKWSECFVVRSGWRGLGAFL